MASIEIEDDARPIVRVLATLLRRSAADPELGSVLDGLDGVLGLQSSTDPQRATIHFRSGDVYVQGGIGDDADVVIETDFSAPTGPGAPKATVRQSMQLAKAVARRPVFAQNAGKVLEPPLPDWTEAAAAFWKVVERRGGGPGGLRAVCTDGDPGALVLGADLDDPPEIHGTARALARCFVGEAVIGEEVMEGRLHSKMSLGDLSILTGHGMAVMFGE